MIKKYPFYMKVTIVLFGMVLFFFMLFILRDILVPLAFALLLAILLNPMMVFLEKRDFPKVLAIAISLLISIIVIVGIAYFLIVEVQSFSSDLPVLKQKLAAILGNLEHAARYDFGVNAKKQQEYINEAENSLRPVIASAMGSVMGTIAIVILLPVYTFLLLFYKKHILQFLYEIFDDADEKAVSVVLRETKGAIQSYTVGLLLEALIVAMLNTIALFILGVKYAVLLGVLGALLNVLPFIGGVLASLLPITIATITKDGFQTQIWVIIAYAVIQFVDNHFLVPYIVASKVKINALVSIIIVLMGGTLWGISGMFLSIPFLGVLKIIFDRLPDMKPWGMLIGIDVPTKRRVKINIGLKKG
jgi:predicted PurR-regulated permease PerM